MSVLTDYLEYEEVRTALGCTDEELTDDTLDLNLNLYGLRVELSQISSSLITDYATVLGTQPSARTSEETQFYEATRVFSVYAVASGLSVGLQNRAPKTITDGKASITRFGEAGEKSVSQKCKESYERFKELLRASYELYQGSSETSVVYNWFSVSSPSTDEITGS